ncbi:MAG: carboxypeptidase regulatory-like domain-containing protein [Chitinophagaceae bacterium]|nr:MAG: carboxypeptidase regulatory-like domain-containing protein [Chitinophagaceae bacterium]
MKGVKKLLLSLSLLPLSLLVKADELPIDVFGKSEPVLHGSITDASTKKPVAGVLVVVTGSRSSDKREFTTDAGGNFKINQMPSGEVTIVLEKRGYKSYRREGIVIKEGLTLKLNMDLKSDDRGEDSDYFHPMMRMMDFN